MRHCSGPSSLCTTTNMQATYTIDPAQPALIDLDRGKRRRAVVVSSLPFRIGSAMYAADFPHNFPDHTYRGKAAVIETLGDRPGALQVSWS